MSFWGSDFWHREKIPVYSVIFLIEMSSLKLLFIPSDDCDWGKDGSKPDDRDRIFSRVFPENLRVHKYIKNAETFNNANFLRHTIQLQKLDH